jgi:hypothetical protein
VGVVAAAGPFLPHLRHCSHLLCPTPPPLTCGRPQKNSAAGLIPNPRPTGRSLRGRLGVGRWALSATTVFKAGPARMAALCATRVSARLCPPQTAACHGSAMASQFLQTCRAGAQARTVRGLYEAKCGTIRDAGEPALEWGRTGWRSELPVHPRGQRESRPCRARGTGTPNRSVRTAPPKCQKIWP